VDLGRRADPVAQAAIGFELTAEQRAFKTRKLSRVVCAGKKVWCWDQDGTLLAKPIWVASMSTTVGGH